MELPENLPQNYASLSTLKTDAQLFEKLSADSSMLITFFAYAAEDEPWSEKHLIFMKACIQWLTVLFSEEKLSTESIQSITRTIHAHHYILKPALCQDLVLLSQDGEISTNGLLISELDHYFYDLVRAAYRTETKEIGVEGFTQPMLLYIKELAESGQMLDLWKKEKSFLQEFLKAATLYNIPRLQIYIEEILKRYIDKNNVIKFMILAHKYNWMVLKQKCFDVLNHAELGVRFQNVEEESLVKQVLSPFSMQFFSFDDRALNLFEKLKSIITHLIIGEELIKSTNFSHVVHSCPHLRSLDISFSNSFSEELSNLPSTLEDLNISMCTWLTNENLKKIIAHCPNLISLSIRGNIQLTYVGWGELKNLKRLLSLDISKSLQITDEDFELILRSAPNLISFNFGECSHLTDKAYSYLVKGLPLLRAISLSRSNVSDGMLGEITSRCTKLAKLDLTRCLEVTNRGLLEAMKFAFGLREITIRQCLISQETISFLKQKYPALVINQ